MGQFRIMSKLGRIIPKRPTTKSANEPPCSPSPRLPPEVLHQILNYLNPTSRDMAVLFDLMSASMVCREWYYVARSIIPDNKLKMPFQYGILFKYGDRLQRFAELLNAAQELGLPYGEEIQTFEIAVGDFVAPTEKLPRLMASYKAYSAEDHEALFTILKVANLTRLKLKIEEIPENSPKRVRQRERFFSQLKEHCSGIPELELVFHDMGRDSCPQEDPHVAEFVTAMHSSLTTVVVRNEPDVLTQASLTRCTNLRAASFHLCKISTADSIARGLKGLRQVEFHNLLGAGTEALLTGMSSASDHLEALSIVSTPHPRIPQGEEVSDMSAALENLLSSSKSLKRLSLVSLPYLNDNVLRAAAKGCRDLEDIDLHRGAELTGENVWDSKTTPWPKLRYMFLMGERIASEFVEQVADASDALEELHLPERLASEAVRGMLEDCGFRMYKGCKNSWLRGKKTPSRCLELHERNEMC